KGAGLGKENGARIVEIAEAALADPADRALDAQRFRATKQVAMPPVALQAETIGVRDLRTKTEIAMLAFGNLDGHGQRTVGRQRRRLADRHAGKDAELAQPVGRLGK